MRLRLIILLTIIFLFIGDINKDNSTTYRSLVDYKGFYKVVIEDTGEFPKYENHTLNINVGDKIIWINDDINDDITIISRQGLWENKSALLKYTGRRFNYTFNNPGIYTFYANRYNPLSKQTVIVSSNKINSTVSTTTIPTVSPSADIVTRPTANPTITSSASSIDNTNTTTIDKTNTINVGNATDENIVLTNPILLPLNILDNLKLTGLITFAIVMIISFIRDTRKNGRKI